MDKYWNQAKQIARDKNRSSDWAFVIDVYTYLGGTEMSVKAVLEEGYTVSILGTLDKSNDLVVTKDKELLKVPRHELMLKPKIFNKNTKEELTLYLDLNKLNVKNPVSLNYRDNKNIVINV